MHGIYLIAGNQVTKSTQEVTNGQVYAIFLNLNTVNS